MRPDRPLRPSDVANVLRARACSSPGKDAGYAEHARGATLELELGQGAPAPASGFKGKAKRTAAKVASEVKHAMDGPEPEPEPAIAQPVRAPAPGPAPSLTLRRQATATKTFFVPRLGEERKEWRLHDLHGSRLRRARRSGVLHNQM